MPLDVPKIIDSLRFLREADRGFTIFGSNGHHYNVRPCIAEVTLVDFERRFSVTLPEDYRQFLLEVGNGGAGPYYGVHGLDELYETNDDYWNDLSKPFPYRDQWVGPPDLMTAIDKSRPFADDDERHDELVDEYWRVASRDGSINICEYGCNLRFLLVLNGPEYGRMWFDATPDMGGYCPVSICPEPSFEQYGKWCITDRNAEQEVRVSFAEWYHAWLDWACRYVERLM